MKQRFFPISLAGHRLKNSQADQFLLFKVVEDLNAAIQQLGQWQIHRRLAQLLEPQARGLQQMRTPYPVLAPQINQALGPAGVGFAKPPDIAECSGIGAWVVVDKGEIGRASCRERGCPYVWISVGAVSL